MIGPGKTKKWWVWSARSEHGVYFLIVPSRGAAAGRELLQNYSGLDLAAYLREAVHRLLQPDRQIFLPSDYQDLIEDGEIRSREQTLS